LHSVAKRSAVGISTKIVEAYKTGKGKMFYGRIEDALESPDIEKVIPNLFALPNWMPMTLIQ
jgi:hypothetical protein